MKTFIIKLLTILLVGVAIYGNWFHIGMNGLTWELLVLDLLTLVAVVILNKGDKFAY